jgi:hypothetical protein
MPKDKDQGSSKPTMGKPTHKEETSFRTPRKPGIQGTKPKSQTTPQTPNNPQTFASLFSKKATPSPLQQSGGIKPLLKPLSMLKPPQPLAPVTEVEDTEMPSLEERLNQISMEENGENESVYDDPEDDDMTGFTEIPRPPGMFQEFLDFLGIHYDAVWEKDSTIEDFVVNILHFTNVDELILLSEATAEDLTQVFGKLINAHQAQFAELICIINFTMDIESQ